AIDAHRATVDDGAAVAGGRAAPEVVPRELAAAHRRRAEVSHGAALGQAVAVAGDQVPGETAGGDGHRPDVGDGPALGQGVAVRVERMAAEGTAPDIQGAEVGDGPAQGRVSVLEAVR